jgi:hypothetical protein
MHPRRLLSLVVILLVLTAGYFLVSWHQERTARQEREARRLLPVKEEEITAIVLRKKDQEIRLVRQEKTWRLEKPLQAKADQETVRSQASLLATLDRERDLGELGDPKAYGLDQPSLVVEVTAHGQTHRLKVGQATPGQLGYYVQRGEENRLYTLSAATKGTLDRPLEAFRDKTLFDFAPDKVTKVRLAAGPGTLELEKTPAGLWRLNGREEVKVRKDRLEAFLRFLTLARVKEFVPVPPSESQLGFAPLPTAEVSVFLPEQPPQSLILGGRREGDYYARQEAKGELFLVESEVGQRLLGLAATLEDRRLWSGEVGEAARLSWGPPDKPWTGVKEKDAWKLTGPDGREVRQPAVRLEAALIKLQELEYDRLLPQAGSGKREFLVEVRDGAGELLFRLTQIGKPDKDKLTVRLERGGKQETALLPKSGLEQWQGDMARLVQPPPDKSGTTP